MTKPEFMLIGSRQWLITMKVSPTLAINDFLVTIDDNLDWGSHIENIIKKLSSGIGAIDARARHLIPQATLHLIYRAVILPRFNCCNTVWGNCRITLRNKLRVLQNRAARVITFSDYNADVVYLFEFLRWQNLTRLHEIDKATMVYKSLHGLAPEYLRSRFTTLELAYNLRDSENKLCTINTVVVFLKENRYGLLETDISLIYNLLLELLQ